MSFGFAIGDFIILSQLASRVVKGAREACGAHDELTREVSSLHIVLRALEREVAKPDSILNSDDDDRKNELSALAEHCEKVLKVLERILEKYNGLSDEKKGVTKFWKKVKFGNGEMVDLSKIRLELATHTNVITMFLNLLSVGSMGKVEGHMSSNKEDLKALRLSVNWITGSLQARGVHGEGSILTSYTSDDKSFWKDLRRELVKEGYSSRVLKKHKTTIRDYVMELGDRGALDDLPEFQDPTSTTNSPDVAPSEETPISQSVQKDEGSDAGKEEGEPNGRQKPEEGNHAKETYAKFQPTKPTETIRREDVDLFPAHVARKYIDLLDPPLIRPRHSRKRQSPIPNTMYIHEFTILYVERAYKGDKLPRLWHPEATDDSARSHCLRPGCNIYRWDPTFKPIVFLGNVFDYCSFGKWIYDWNVEHHSVRSRFTVQWGIIWILLSKITSIVHSNSKSRSYPLILERCEDIACSLQAEFKHIVQYSEKSIEKGLSVGSIPTEGSIKAFVDNISQMSVFQPTGNWTQSALWWSERFDDHWRMIDHRYMVKTF